MSGAFSVLKSLDTAHLDVHLELSQGVVKGDVFVSLQALDPRDLLGKLGDLLRNVEGISDPKEIAGVILAGMQEFADAIDISGLDTVGKVLNLLTRLLAQIKPLIEELGVEPEALFDRALDGYGGLDGLIAEVVSRFAEGFSAELPESIRLPVAAVQQLTGGPLQNGEELARFLAGFLLGLELDDIEAPARLVQGLRAQLTVHDGHIDPIRISVGQLTTQIETVIINLSGEAPDFITALDVLASTRANLARLAGELLPPAFAGLNAALGAIDTESLSGELAAALKPWLARTSEAPIPLGEMLLEPLRGLAESIETMPADFLDERFAALEATIDELFGRSEVGRLAEEAEGLLEGLSDYLQQIPLAQLREQLSTALLAVEAKIRSLEAFSPVYQLADHLQSLESAIEQVDIGAIQNRVQDLANRIQQVIDGFPIEALRIELESLVAAASDAVAGIGPALDEAGQAIDTVSAQLTAIDLSGAGDASLQLIRDIRQNLKQALTSAGLPEAARVALGVVAGQVRKIDLRAELKVPFSSVAAKIDVAALTAPLDEALAEARTALGKLTPSALIKQLDQPFNELSAGLEQINPARLVAELARHFEEFLSLLNQADPRILIAPLQAEFDRIIAELLQSFDPAPLFQPLKDTYEELQGLINRIDPTPLLAKVLARVSEMPGLIAEATGKSFTTSLGVGVDLPTGTESGVFHFGDVLRPFAALVQEIRGAVHGATEELIEEGLARISSPLIVLRELAVSGGGFVAEVSRSLEEQRALIDFTAAQGPMADLRAAIDQLTRVEAELAVAGRSSFTLGQAVASVQLDVHISASAGLRTDLDTRQSGFCSALSSLPSAAGLGQIGAVLENIVPAPLFLPDAETTALARIDALFDAFSLDSLVAEMDSLGDRITARLQSLAADIARALIRLWDRIFALLKPILPQGLLPVVTAGMDEIRHQLGLLDPAGVEAEIDELLEAVVTALRAYSPAAFADELGVLFDAVKAKMHTLDPAALLGDLDPVAGLIEKFQKLKPSIILAPLVAQTQALEEALAKLLDFDVGEILVEAVARLRAELELIIESLAGELDGLLSDLGGGDGEISVSANVSIG